MNYLISHQLVMKNNGSVFQVKDIYMYFLMIRVKLVLKNTNYHLYDVRNEMLFNDTALSIDLSDPGRTKLGFYLKFFWKSCSSKQKHIKIISIRKIKEIIDHSIIYGFYEFLKQHELTTENKLININKDYQSELKSLDILHKIKKHKLSSKENYKKLIDILNFYNPIDIELL